MNSTVKMNGNKGARTINVIRKQTLTIKTASGEEQKVKLTFKKQDPSTMTTDDKCMVELQKLFPKQTKPKEEDKYSCADDYAFAQEMQAQIDKFIETNRHGKRGRRKNTHSGHKSNCNDWS